MPRSCRIGSRAQDGRLAVQIDGSNHRPLARMLAQYSPESITAKASSSMACSVQSTRITQRKRQVVSVAVRDRSSKCSISLRQCRYFYALTRERQLHLYHLRGSGPRQEAALSVLRMKAQRRSRSGQPPAHHVAIVPRARSGAPGIGRPSDAGELFNIAYQIWALSRSNPLCTLPPSISKDPILCVLRLPIVSADSTCRLVRFRVSFRLRHVQSADAHKILPFHDFSAAERQCSYE